MTNITPADMDALETLEKAATGGEWFVDEWISTIIWAKGHQHRDSSHMRVADIRGWGHLTGCGASNYTDENAQEIQEATGALICKLRNHAPALIAAARERDTLRAEIQLLKHQLHLEYSDVVEVFMGNESRSPDNLTAERDAALARAEALQEEVANYERGALAIFREAYHERDTLAEQLAQARICGLWCCLNCEFMTIYIDDDTVCACEGDIEWTQLCPESYKSLAEQLAQAREALKRIANDLAANTLINPCAERLVTIATAALAAMEAKP